MSAVNVIGRAAHIDRAFIDLLNASAYRLQVLRGVNLGAEHIPDIYRIDAATVRNLVERILCIAFAVIVLTETLYGIKPYQPVLFKQFVEGLGCHCIIKELNAHFLYPAVSDYSLEILIRQRKRTANGHTTDFTVQNGLKDKRFKDQVSVHQYHVIILEIISCAVDAVDVVGLVVYRVVDESELYGQMQSFAIILKYGVVITCGHYNLIHSECHQFLELTAQNGVVRRDLSHTLGMGVGYGTHPVA